MSRHDPNVRLLHMRDYARKAIQLIQGKDRAEVDANEVLLLALTHLVELIGEAASQVPPALRAQHSQLPWPKIVGMRHRLVHGYDVLDYDILWDTIQYDLPSLVQELDRIIGEGSQIAGG